MLKIHLKKNVVENDMDDIYKNIEEQNPNKKQKLLIVFDDMVADMLSKKTTNPVVTELFIRQRILNIYLVFITQSYFAVPKNVTLTSTQYFAMKIPSKRKLQQTALNHSSDTDFQDFTNLYKNSTVEPYYFMVVDITLPSGNSNLLEKI